MLFLEQVMPDEPIVEYSFLEFQEYLLPYIDIHIVLMLIIVFLLAGILGVIIGEFIFKRFR